MVAQPCNPHTWEKGEEGREKEREEEEKGGDGRVNSSTYKLFRILVQKLHPNPCWAAVTECSRLGINN